MNGHIITEKPNPHKDGLHAAITDKYKRSELEVHFAENEEDWKSGVMRIVIKQGGKEYEREIMIDALMSVVFTAYDPTIVQKVIGIFRHILIRIKSWLYVKKEKSNKASKEKNY